MNEEYPENYNGPKAGQATQQEWVDVRDYNAFKYIADGTWSYADFDCYLYSMCEKHYKLGESRALDALKEFQKVIS